MAEDKKEQKIMFEREYIVPLRRAWQKVQRYRRAKKALRALKEFIARHMKVYDRDLRKIKVDTYLNNEIWFKGIKKPLNKIKVKAIKYEDGTVAVKLVQLPKHIEFELARKAKKEAERLTKSKAEAKEEKVEEKKEETKDTKQKVESSKEATQAIEKAQAKQAEHTSKTSQEVPKIQRKALKR